MDAKAIKTIEVFQYEQGAEPAVGPWPGFDEAGETEPAEAQQVKSGSGARPPLDEALRVQLEQNAIDEARRGFEAGRERGITEGRQAEREALASERQSDDKRRAEQVAALVQRFAEDREQYLRAVEHEVVTLALAVAARILRREAQMDPLLLTGAVRVALGQLSNTTEVRLHVPKSELDLWREAIAHVPNLKVKPVVEAGDGMLVGDCSIQTSVGSVDIGIRAQLSEIERGFFDRAGHPPTAVPVGPMVGVEEEVQL